MKEFFKNKKIAVTGGSGFIGTHYLIELVNQGAKVITHTHKSPLQYNHESIVVHENLDLTKLDTFEYKEDPIMDGFITSSNGASQGYVKEFIRNYGNDQLLEAELDLYEFSDSVSARQSFEEQQKDHFSKMIVDEDTGKEKRNPFYSEKIEIETIGDASFCYKFVTSTVVVLYGKYIIESGVTVTILDGVRVVGPFTLENSFLDNKFTLGKSVEIAKKQFKQCNKPNGMNHHQHGQAAVSMQIPCISNCN